MLEIQAAVGRIQLRRMTEWTARRQANATVLVAALQPFSTEAGPVRLPQQGCIGCTTEFRDGGVQLCVWARQGKPKQQVAETSKRTEWTN